MKCALRGGRLVVGGRGSGAACGMHGSEASATFFVSLSTSTTHDTHIHTFTGVLPSALQYYRTNVPGMLRVILTQLLGGLFGKGQFRHNALLAATTTHNCSLAGVHPISLCPPNHNHHHHHHNNNQQTYTGNRTAAEPPPAPVLRVPTLGISGLQDGCMRPKVFDLTMGGGADGERCVRAFDVM